MGAGCSPGRDSSPRRCRQTQQHSAEDRLSTTQTCARRLADSRRRLRDHHRTTPAPASPSEGLRPPQTPHHVVAALNRDHQRRLPRGVPVPQPDPDQAARRPVREPDTPTDVRVPERQGPGSATSTSSTCSTCSLPTEPNSNTPLTTEGVSRQGWTRLGHDRLCWILQTTEARKVAQPDQPRHGGQGVSRSRICSTETSSQYLWASSRFGRTISAGTRRLEPGDAGVLIR